MILYENIQYVSFQSRKALAVSEFRNTFPCHLSSPEMKLKLVVRGLRLAALPHVSLEALAKTCRKVADSTARAIPSALIAITIKRITLRRALDERAVRSTETIVTLAPIAELGVPRGIVLSGHILAAGGLVARNNRGVVTGELLKTLASTVAIAVVGADQAATSLPSETVKALTLSSFAIAETLA